MKLGLAVTRAHALDETWTTTHLALAALGRGHEVSLFAPGDLEVDERGRVVARAARFLPPAPSAEALVQQLRTHTAPRVYLRIDHLDVLLLRASPLDPGLFSFALRAQQLGVTVVNDPAGLMAVRHKGWLASLPDVATPRTLVTARRGSAHLFARRTRGRIVVKPAEGSGGRGVSLVKRADLAALDRAFDLATARSRHVVLQEYLPEAEAGEKRLVWMDGEVLGGYLRRRAPGEFRHNLKRGGRAEPTRIPRDEHEIVAPLSRHLLAHGIRLAGLDLIGRHVVEVNALNPGGAYHADRLHGTDITGSIIDGLAGDAGPSTTRRASWVHPDR